MAAKDFYHDLVKELLIKDGWEITDDPLRMDDWEPGLKIDLGAEKLLGARKGTQKIAVEIKSFLGESIIYQFHNALGQYFSYLNGLEYLEPERVLFMAIPLEIYEEHFLRRRMISTALIKFNIHLLVFDPLTKTIARWIQ